MLENLYKRIKYLATAIALALAFTLSGCATTGPDGEVTATGGSVVYVYSHTNPSTGEQTTVNIHSGRDIGSASIEVTPEGGLKATAEKLDSSTLSRDALGVASDAVKALLLQAPAP